MPLIMNRIMFAYRPIDKLIRLGPTSVVFKAKSPQNSLIKACIRQFHVHALEDEAVMNLPDWCRK